MYVEMFTYEHIPYLFWDSLERSGIPAAVSKLNSEVKSIQEKQMRSVKLLKNASQIIPPKNCRECMNNFCRDRKSVV